VDADLGGANLHTMMGIKTPVRTLNDFICRKYPSIADICIKSAVDNLEIVCGASEILSLANPQYAQKNKIVQSIATMQADHVILDLGAGTSYNVLDFYLIAHNPIVVLTPQPISIQNAYGFIRNTVYRKLSRLTAQKPSLQNLIKTAMDPRNDKKIRTLYELYEMIARSHSESVALKIQEAVSSLHPLIITNMAKDERDQNAGKIIQLVAEKYLAIQSQDLGAIQYDQAVESMTSQMMPLSDLPDDGSARLSAENILKKLKVLGNSI
jgi:flagellar biosynthesis protein FlhG